MAVVFLHGAGREPRTRSSDSVIGRFEFLGSQIVSFPANDFAEQFSGGEHSFYPLPPEALCGGLIPPGDY